MERTVTSRYLYKGRILNLRRDTVTLHNGRITTREIVENGCAAAVLHVREGRVLLVRQYRKAVEDFLLEIPAGRFEEGEQPEECAAREFEEETGMKACNLEPVCEFFPAPGFSTEKLFLFYTDKAETGRKNLDEDEDIEIFFHELEDIRKMIADGRITDSKTIIAVYWYLCSRRDL